MNKLTKGLVSMYVAGSLFLSGCATNSYTKRYTNQTRPSPHSRITFIPQNSSNIDDLISTSEGFSNSLRHMGEFNRIKNEIRTNRNYNPQQDVRRLARNIEYSSLEDKSNLLRIVKDFSYYKEDIIKKSRYIDQDNLSFVGLGAGLTYMATTYDPDAEDQSGPILIGALIALGVMGILYKIGQWLGLEKDEETKIRILVKPYYGTERVIETNPR